MWLWSRGKENKPEPLWVSYRLLVSNFDDKCFLYKKLVPLCHGAKHTPRWRTQSRRCRRIWGSWGSGYCYHPARNQGVSANRQELQQCLSQNQPSQLQELGLHFCLPCLGLNWSHEEKVESGKCSFSLANWTLPLLPGMFMKEMSKQMQETLLLQAFLYFPHLQSVQEIFSNYVF